MFDWLADVEPDGAAAGRGRAAPGGILEFLGGSSTRDRSDLGELQCRRRRQSVINVIEKIVFIIVILAVADALDECSARRRSPWSDSR